ncbi:MAG: hypothetical protein DLM72_14515 [Candidatus Nitrosopolaris wilkensis]|nr:MAG: hypothetical protein DLM72_14515 [Candidatus Nitrosopolaris wilkensis]
MYRDKLRQRLANIQDTQTTDVISQLRGLPFWIWDTATHEQEYGRTKGRCCFNHAIPAGLPIKDKTRRPIYGWQKAIFDALFDNNDSVPYYQKQHVAILKARGIGGTSLAIRILAWLCVKDDNLAGSQMCIVTGNRSELAVAIVDRLRQLFWNKDTDVGLIFDSKESVVNLNNVRIEAFPSHRIESMRGLPWVSFAIADECSSWMLSEQQPALDVLQGYVQKSKDYHLLLLSTAGYPGDLMDKIFRQPEESCIFRRLRMDWTVGAGSIYSQDDIDKSRMTSSWDREMLLRFSGFQGNVYPTNLIEQAIQEYPLQIDVDAGHISMGIDVAWSSSATGVTLCMWRSGIVYVIYSEEFVKADYNELLDHCDNLIESYNPTKCYIDAANPEFYRALMKRRNQEDFDILKKREMDMHLPYGQLMNPVQPIPWQKHGREMLVHSRFILEKGKLRIHPSMEKLILSLKTAYEVNGLLDKQVTLHNDCYDSFIAALKFYRFK